MKVIYSIAIINLFLGVIGLCLSTASLLYAIGIANIAVAAVCALIITWNTGK